MHAPVECCLACLFVPSKFDKFAKFFAKHDFVVNSPNFSSIRYKILERLCRKQCKALVGETTKSKGGHFAKLK